MANPIIYAFTRDDLRQVANQTLRSCLKKLKKSDGNFKSFTHKNGSLTHAEVLVEYVSPIQNGIVK